MRAMSHECDGVMQQCGVASVVELAEAVQGRRLDWSCLLARALRVALRLFLLLMAVTSIDGHTYGITKNRRCRKCWSWSWVEESRGAPSEKARRVKFESSRAERFKWLRFALHSEVVRHFNLGPDFT